MCIYYIYASVVDRRIRTHTHYSYTILTRRLHNVLDVDGKKWRARSLEDRSTAQLVTHEQTDTGGLHQERQRGDDIAVTAISSSAWRLLANTQLPTAKLVWRYAEEKERRQGYVEKEREKENEKGEDRYRYRWLSHRHTTNNYPHSALDGEEVNWAFQWSRERLTFCSPYLDGRGDSCDGSWGSGRGQPAICRLWMRNERVQKNTCIRKFNLA